MHYSIENKPTITTKCVVIGPRDRGYLISLILMEMPVLNRKMMSASIGAHRILSKSRIGEARVCAVFPYEMEHAKAE